MILLKKIYACMLLLLCLYHHQGFAQLELGSLDPLFGTAGRVLSSFPAIAGGQAITGVAILANGDIFAVGNNDTMTASVIAKYLKGGVLDPTFGTNNSGALTVDNLITNAIAVQNNSTLITSGALLNLSPPKRMVIQNFSRNGALIPGFNNNNSVSFLGFSLGSEARSVAIDTQSRIVAAGFAINSAGGQRFALARFNSNGSTDNSFGVLGARITNVSRGSGVSNNNTDESINGVTTVNQNNSIAVAGTARINNEVRFIVASYTNTGALNTNFNPTGIEPGTIETLFTPLVGNLPGVPRVDRANAITTQIVDGVAKIVAVGAARTGVSTFGLAIARYNLDGTLDTTFGQIAQGQRTGMVVNSFGGADVQANAVVIDEFNNILIAGQHRIIPTSNNQFFVASYNQDGDLNIDFGTNGVVLTSFDEQSAIATALALDENNSILVGGVNGTGVNARFALARYIGKIVPPDPGPNPQPIPGTPGSLDTGFGSFENGLVFSEFPFIPGGKQVKGLTILPTGDIIAAGGNDVPPTERTAIVASYLSNGLPNTKFFNLTGSAGYSTRLNSDANAVTTNTFRGLTIVTSGFIAFNPIQFSISGHNSSGEDQVSFRNFAGLNFLDSTGSIARAIAADGSDNLFVAGFVANGADQNFGLVKTSSSGFIDESFGDNGFVQTYFANPNRDFSHINGIALYPNNQGGKIVVAGDAVIDNQQRFVLARYLSTGELDPTFGALVDPLSLNGPHTGKVIVDFLPITFVPNRNDRANAVALQIVNGETKIVAVGFTARRNSGSFFVLARLNDDGTLDPSFGYPETGIRINCFGSVSDEARAVVIDADNKIVVTGIALTSSSSFFGSQFITARYTENGGVDHQFGIDGTVFTGFFQEGAGANSVALQTDGKIVVGGFAIQNGLSVFALARYNG